MFGTCGDAFRGLVHGSRISLVEESPGEWGEELRRGVEERPIVERERGELAGELRREEGRPDER